MGEGERGGSSCSQHIEIFGVTCEIWEGGCVERKHLKEEMSFSEKGGGEDGVGGTMR